MLEPMVCHYRWAKPTRTADRIARYLSQDRPPNCLVHPTPTPAYAAFSLMLNGSIGCLHPENRVRGFRTVEETGELRGVPYLLPPLLTKILPSGGAEGRGKVDIGGE